MFPETMAMVVTDTLGINMTKIGRKKNTIYLDTSAQNLVSTTKTNPFKSYKSKCSKVPN